MPGIFLEINVASRVLSIKVCEKALNLVLNDTPLVVLMSAKSFQTVLLARLSNLQQHVPHLVECH